MLRDRPWATKFDGGLEALRAKPAAPSELERLEVREATWRGAPEWAIREEMERALARRLRRRRAS